MATLFDARTRSALHERIDKLEPASARQWGRMDASQMVCHVAYQLRVALGDLDTDVSPGFLRFRPLRQVLVYWLPWPKGKIATAPEMLTTQPSDWVDDVATLHSLIDRAGEAVPADTWAAHPLVRPLVGP